MDSYTSGCAQDCAESFTGMQALAAEDEKLGCSGTQLPSCASGCTEPSTCDVFDRITSAGLCGWDCKESVEGIGFLAVVAAKLGCDFIEQQWLDRLNPPDAGDDAGDDAENTSDDCLEDCNNAQALNCDNIVESYASGCASDCVETFQKVNEMLRCGNSGGNTGGNPEDCLQDCDGAQALTCDNIMDSYTSGCAQDCAGSFAGMKALFMEEGELGCDMFDEFPACASGCTSEPVDCASFYATHADDGTNADALCAADCLDSAEGVAFLAVIAQNVGCDFDEEKYIKDPFKNSADSLFLGATLCLAGLLI